MIKLHHLSLVTGVTLATLSLTGVMTKIGDRIRMSSLLKPAQAQKELSSPIAKATLGCFPRGSLATTRN